MATTEILPTAARPAEAAPPQAQKEDRINLRRMVKILLTLALGMGAAVGLCFLLEPEPPVAVANIIFPGGMEPLRPWRYIVIHHTGPGGATLETANESHRQERSSGSAAAGCFHFLIADGLAAPDGKILPTSAWLKQLPGGHCRVEHPRETLQDFGGPDSYNESGIGLALVGDLTSRPPTPAQMDSLVETIYVLTTRLNISATHVLVHDELEATDCPGAKFPKDELLRRLSERYRRPASN
jgi:hypothetical protein